MTPGCDSRGRNDLRGRGGPQRGSVSRVRLYSVTDDAVVDGSPVRLCWVGERSRSGGRASAATARSCGSSVARCARRRGVRRRCPGRCTVGRAARRGSRAPACGRWQGSIPVSDALWAQRLTPRREKFLKRRRPQLVDATNRLNTSDAFIQPNVCRGRLLSSRATACNSARV